MNCASIYNLAWQIKPVWRGKSRAHFHHRPAPHSPASPHGGAVPRALSKLRTSPLGTRRVWEEEVEAGLQIVVPIFHHQNFTSSPKLIVLIELILLFLQMFRDYSGTTPFYCYQSLKFVFKITARSEDCIMILYPIRANLRLLRVILVDSQTSLIHSYSPGER